MSELESQYGLGGDGVPEKPRRGGDERMKEASGVTCAQTSVLPMARGLADSPRLFR